MSAETGDSGEGVGRTDFFTAIALAELADHQTEYSVDTLGDEHNEYVDVGLELRGNFVAVLLEFDADRAEQVGTDLLDAAERTRRGE